MKQLIQTLEAERLNVASQLAAIDKALDALTSVEFTEGAPKVESNGHAKKKKVKAKRPVPAKTECPDCGKLYRGGAGLAAHRSAAHGWRKGQPLDRPVPRAAFQ